MTKRLYKIIAVCHSGTICKTTAHYVDATPVKIPIHCHFLHSTTAAFVFLPVAACLDCSRSASLSRAFLFAVTSSLTHHHPTCKTIETPRVAFTVQHAEQREVQGTLSLQRQPHFSFVSKRSYRQQPQLVSLTPFKSALVISHERTLTQKSPANPPSSLHTGWNANRSCGRAAEQWP